MITATIKHSPRDLGSVLGLDQAPEVKTLRRKLARLAAAERAAQFGKALAQQRISLRGTALGFLYVDGCVRVYHGQHAFPETHVARMRISLPATSDYDIDRIFAELRAAETRQPGPLIRTADELRNYVAEEERRHEATLALKEAAPPPSADRKQ